MLNEIIKKIDSNNFKEAEILTNEYIKKNPQDSYGYYLLGYIYLKINKYDLSLDFFYQSVTKEENIRYLFGYASILTKTKNFLRAIDCYKKILIIENNHEPSIVNLGYLYFLIKILNEEKCEIQLILFPIDLVYLQNYL